MKPANNTEHTARWQLAGVLYDSSNRQLQRGEQKLYLEPRQHKLLLVLLQNAAQVVSREQLINSVWDGRIVSESAINRAVSMLRKAFLNLDPQTDYIETLPKLGYRLQHSAVIVTSDLSTAEPIAPARRQRWPEIIVIALLLCSTAGWLLFSRPTPQLSAGNPVPHTAFNGRESQLSGNRQAQALLYQRLADNGNHQIWLNTLADNQHHLMTPDNEDSRYAALSPDGRQFAFVRYATGNCQIMLQQITLPPAPRPSTAIAPEQAQILHQCPADSASSLSWQADGKALYFRQRQDKTQPYQLYQLSIATGALRQLTLMAADYSGDGNTALAAAPRSGQLAVLRYISANASELQILNSNTGEIVQLQPLSVRANAVAWYSDNVVLLSAGKTLYQYHIGRKHLSPLFNAADPINSLVAVDDMVYFSSTELRADIWQSDLSGVTSLRINSSRLDTMPRLSHDAAQLAFLSTRQGHEQLWLQQQDGTQRLLTELPGQPGFVRPEWSADDRQLLFSKGYAAYSVDIASGTLQTQLTGDKRVGVVNWGPDDSSLLYSSQRGGDWQLWWYDIASQTERQITSQGGYSGRIWQNKLYFSKYHHDGLWVKDLFSDDEQLLLAQFDKINWLNWHIDQGQLYYYTPGQGIYRLDLTLANSTLQLAEPSHFVRQFSVRNGQTVYVRHSELQGDIYRLPLQLSR